ncbi:DUF402 domain-containing protein [Alicyclobacillus fastidiosus]|uniref:DUF402 domain-containing protein n=1 Tax=Alicyclobacillus fastidiosus TaxID=392011 RepID=A0ABV5ALX4_9BACL|nr:DUF402 domain-containing protein [Alicyclobacillus fastidiosus]WEH07978.1 DUF402 domain-containing protein [Alicyclobacillus fastidiosus]
MREKLTIRALKYPDIPHYDWEVELLEEASTHVICIGLPGRKLVHHTKQKVFDFDSCSIEFYSLEHWVTVSADIVNGALQQYYCNIAMPAIRDKSKSTVSFIDLDLDLVRRSLNLPWKVVDVEEFHTNQVKYGYPSSLVVEAKQQLQELQNRVRKSLFPFDGKLQFFIDQVIEQNHG